MKRECSTTERAKRCLPKVVQRIKQDEKLTLSCLSMSDLQSLHVMHQASYSILISNCWSRTKNSSFKHKFDATCKLACTLKSNRSYASKENKSTQTIAHCVCKQSQNQIISISNFWIGFVLSTFLLFRAKSSRQVLGNVVIQSNLFEIQFSLSLKVFWCFSLLVIVQGRMYARSQPMRDRFQRIKRRGDQQRVPTLFVDYHELYTYFWN